MRNRDTRALITGGAQGLGLAVAERLIAEGATSVALVGRDKAKGESAVRELAGCGAEAVFIRADVGDVDDCRRAFAEATERLGHVNALVNSAATTERGSLTETTPEIFDRIFAINVRGPFFLMQELTKHLLARGAPGSVVNVLSMSAHCGQSFLVPYSASKAALATITKNAANAYRGKRIRFNAVMPGWMDTPGEAEVQAKFHAAKPDWLEKAEAAQPMGQLVKPDELASLTAYMLSPESGVMTGSLVDYDQNVAGAMPE